MLIYLGFKVLKPPLQLLDGLTLEAIGCLQLPNPFRKPALVPGKGFRTEVGLTLLRASPIFFVTSCFYALRFGLAMLGLRALCEQKQAPSAKSAAKLQNKCPITLDSFGKNAKNLHFFTKSVKIGSKITRFRSNSVPRLFLCPLRPDIRT